MHTAAASDQITSVLLTVGDFEPAVQMASKRLAMAVQLQGLDGSDVLLQHSQLSSMLQELKQTPQAIHHLLSAKYIVELTAGPRHLDLVGVYARLGALYEEVGDHDNALRCLNQARVLTNDLMKNCMHTTNLASFHSRRGRFSEAFQYQHHVYAFLKEMLPEKDERLVECTSFLELYIRQAEEAAGKAEKDEQQKQQKIAVAAAPVVPAAAPKTDADVAVEGAATAEEGEKKKKRHAKKNKSKK